MNALRRTHLGRISDQIEILKCSLEDILEDETSVSNGIPEGLHDGPIYARARHYVSSLEQAVKRLNEALDAIHEARE